MYSIFYFFTGRVEEKNPVDALGMTPFRLAISNGNHSLVRLTINQNVRKTVENVTAFVGVFVAIYSAIHSFNLGYLAFSGGLIFLAALFCWGSVGALFLAFFGVVPRRPRWELLNKLIQLKNHCWNKLCIVWGPLVKQKWVVTIRGRQSTKFVV